MSLHQPNTASVTNNTDPPLTVHGPGPMVTRIRRRAIMITFLLGSALVMMVLLVGFNSSTPSRRIGGTEEASNRPTGPGESVRDLPGDYSFDVRRAAQSINYDQVTKPPVIVVSTAKPQGVAIDPNIAEQLKELAELRRA